MTSVHDTIPSPKSIPYSAAKGGLLTVTRSLSLELAPLKINVNSIAPGQISTPMNAGRMEDPKKHADAVKYDELTFIDALKQRLNVMDSTAFSLCLDNNVPILVFDLNDEHAIRKAVLGDKVGTLVHS